ncbi:hypothetical protein BDV93DRAFT_582290 [Ceratobasidium sp. AG-I]|nr:hypothetical protein BDV93DRAFT_582290 [Ceratobasidium sp. AG-I]
MREIRCSFLLRGGYDDAGNLTSSTGRAVLGNILLCSSMVDYRLAVPYLVLWEISVALRCLKSPRVFFQTPHLADGIGYELEAESSGYVALVDSRASLSSAHTRLAAPLAARPLRHTLSDSRQCQVLASTGYAGFLERTSATITRDSALVHSPARCLSRATPTTVCEIRALGLSTAESNDYGPCAIALEHFNIGAHICIRLGIWVLACTWRRSSKWGFDYSLYITLNSLVNASLGSWVVPDRALAGSADALAHLTSWREIGSRSAPSGNLNLIPYVYGRCTVAERRQGGRSVHELANNLLVRDQTGPSLDNQRMDCRGSTTPAGRVIHDAMPRVSDISYRVCICVSKRRARYDKATSRGTSLWSTVECCAPGQVYASIRYLPLYGSTWRRLEANLPYACATESHSNVTPKAKGAPAMRTPFGTKSSAFFRGQDKNTVVLSHRSPLVKIYRPWGYCSIEGSFYEDYSKIAIEAERLILSFSSIGRESVYLECRKLASVLVSRL